MTSESTTNGITEATQNEPESVLRIADATRVYGRAAQNELGCWAQQSGDTIDALSRVTSLDALALGFALALKAIERESREEPAARAMHRAWLTQMHRQHRDVARERTKWELLLDADKILDASIAEAVARYLIETVMEIPDAA